MAIQTRDLAKVSDAQEPPQYATLTIQYDDALLRMTNITVVNFTNRIARLTAQRSDGSGPTYTFDTAAGATTSQNIPGNAQNRLGISIDSRGRVDGVEWHFGLEGE